MKKISTLFSLMAMIVVAGAACLSSGGAKGTAAPELEEGLAPTKTEEGLPAPTTQPAAEKTIDQAGVEEPLPTARIGLQASDPEIVSLATGEIQLVEFFAFW